MSLRAPITLVCSKLRLKSFVYNRSSMKLVFLLFLLGLVAAIGACGQDDTKAAIIHALDQEIPQLTNGASVREVEDHLGTPRTRAEVFDGTLVYYGPWQLLFNPGLVSRARHYRAGYWDPRAPVANLDGAVHRLKLGSSLEEVKRLLGQPESWQIAVPGKMEALWYGPDRWKLNFSFGDLSRKVL